MGQLHPGNPGFPRWSVPDGTIRTVSPCDSRVSSDFGGNTQWVTGDNRLGNEDIFWVATTLTERSQSEEDDHEEVV